MLLLQVPLGQACPQTPQFWGSDATMVQPDAHCVNPVWHCEPQASGDPVHVATAFAGGTQAVHDEPHVAGSESYAHVFPHGWYSALQVKLQA